MSQKEPTECYVYQPGRLHSGGTSEIFALAGPGSERYKGQRFMRKDADRLCSVANAKREMETCSDRIMKRLEGFTFEQILHP